MDHTPFFGRRVAAFPAVLLLASAIFGCSGTDRLKKQVSGLETQLTAMRADQDRLEERLAAVELNAAVPRQAPAAAADRVERPRLKVIHLAPDGPEASSEPAVAPPSAAAEPAGRRPIIRGTGDRVIKVGDPESQDESTRRDEPVTKPVAQLSKDTHGN